MALVVAYISVSLYPPDEPDQLAYSCSFPSSLFQWVLVLVLGEEDYHYYYYESDKVVVQIHHSLYTPHQPKSREHHIAIPFPF